MIEELRTKQARIDALTAELESSALTLADAERTDAAARADALIEGRDYSSPSSLKALRQRVADLRAALPIAEDMLQRTAKDARLHALEHFAPFQKKQSDELIQARLKVRLQIEDLQMQLEQIETTFGKRVEEMQLLGLGLIDAKSSAEVLHAVDALSAFVESAANEAE